LSDKLARALAGLAPPNGDPASRKRRAELWQGHGELARKKDPEAPTGAFEHVVALDPEQLPAREALATLYKDRAGYEDAAIENHRRLLARAGTRGDSVRRLA